MLPFKHIIVADAEFEFGGHDTFEAASRSGERHRRTRTPAPPCVIFCACTGGPLARKPGGSNLRKFWKVGGFRLSVAKLTIEKTRLFGTSKQDCS
jgi:hypothetical protein